MWNIMTWLAAHVDDTIEASSSFDQAQAKKGKAIIVGVLRDLQGDKIACVKENKIAKIACVRDAEFPGVTVTRTRSILPGLPKTQGDWGSAPLYTRPGLQIDPGLCVTCADIGAQQRLLRLMHDVGLCGDAVATCIVSLNTDLHGQLHKIIMGEVGRGKPGIMIMVPMLLKVLPSKLESQLEESQLAEWKAEMFKTLQTLR